MNDRKDTGAEDADHDLRRELQRAQRGSSAAHDDAVLAQAAAAADEIAGRKAGNSATRPASTQTRRFAWMLSAAALAAIMLVPMLTVERDEGLRRQDEVVTPEPNARLAGAPADFKWPFVPGADRYTLVLRDAGAGEVWRSAPVSEPQLSPDASAQSLLDAGGTFIWTIEAAAPGVTTELGPFQFTVLE